MKTITMAAIGAAMALTLVSAVFANRNTTLRKMAPAGKGFAVLELFTLGAMLSCPPADALLARIQEEAGTSSSISWLNQWTTGTGLTGKIYSVILGIQNGNINIVSS